MRRLKMAVALVMLALWLPATLHCQLETVPGLAFLGCVPETDAHGSDDCQTDGCAVVESADYLCNARDHQNTSLPPVLGLPVAPLSATSPPVAGTQPGLFPHPDAPYRSASWQFLVRAAPAPRAPSHAS